MTGTFIDGPAEYVERRLVEVEDATGRITYFAVTDKTEDNMLISESGLSHSHDPLLRCKMRLLGNVLVEQPINNDSQSIERNE